MGRLEAVKELVASAEQQLSLAESMGKALGENIADVLRTITGLG